MPPDSGTVDCDRPAAVRCEFRRAGRAAGVGNGLGEPVAKLLQDADFLFLAGDPIQSRRVFNALVHQHLAPGVRSGGKVLVDRGTAR